MPEGPRRDFDLAYRAGTAPWDIGRPQPALHRLLVDGELEGDVVDLGCGTGENALWLASLGRRVVGIDGAPTAIEIARRKAAERGVAATFLVADALDLARIRRRFETGIDCGLFHTFDATQARAYAQSLCEVLSPGSTLHLLCFSDAEPPGPGPRRVREEDVRAAFRGIFALTRLEPSAFERREGPPAKAWLARLVRI